MKRIMLLSSVHPAADPRIYYKIAPLLASEYEVVCMLPDAGKNRSSEFAILSVPFFQKLLLRVLLCHPVMLWQCLRLRPALIHIFVPELIPLALLMNWLGVEIIYEVQENLYKKFSIKTFNNSLLLQRLFRYFDHVARRKFNLVFTEKAYLSEYRNLARPFTIVQNFVSLPITDRFACPRATSRPEFFYAGVISMERSFDTMIAAFARLKQDYPDFHLHLFGTVRISQAAIVALPGFAAVRDNITFYGYTDQKTAFRYAQGCIAGIALLKPVADYPDSYTTKLFEYMALELPVITSDFPAYRKIIEPSQCGFCISPYDSEGLYQKMAYLIAHAPERGEMGSRGRNFARKNCNWTTEGEKLLTFYRQVMQVG